MACSDTEAVADDLLEGLLRFLLGLLPSGRGGLAIADILVY